MISIRHTSEDYITLLTEQKREIGFHYIKGESTVWMSYSTQLDMVPPSGCEGKLTYSELLALQDVVNLIVKAWEE